MNSQDLTTNSSQHNATASEVKKSSHLGFWYSDTMPRHKKKTKSAVSIPNYSLYEFVEQMPIFVETDRVPESDLPSLECYNNYEIEAPLNHFNDSMLNNHLYTMYKQGKLESPDLMRKLLCFFSRKYHGLIEPKVNDYLKSKKLTFDDWMTPVKNHRRGDIVCVYLLSMVTGIHTAIHLKNNKIWCTLKAVPLLHHELVERCPVHLVYMGFGIFLRLKQTKNQESCRILGTITSEDPEVRAQLHLLVKTEKPDDGNSLQKTNITATAGSESQLHRLEHELSQDVSPVRSSQNVISKPKDYPKVEIMPFRVILKKLSDATLKKYTRQPETTFIETAKKLHLKKLSIPVKRLSLTPSQSVFLCSPRKSPSLKKDTSTTLTTKKPHKKRCLISGHPSLQQQSVLTFQFQQHTLRR